MDLDTAVDELYGLDPSDFTARRDALAAEARKGGDRDLAASVKSLRRPSAAAYAVNLMARTRGEEIDRLLDLGRRLREAQAALSGDDLRALGRQRQQVVAGLAHETRRVSRDAGHAISDSVAREVESTFEAALADEAAGEAVRQGRLIRALERSGMDPVDLDGAVAGGTTVPPAGGAAGQATAGRDGAGRDRAGRDRVGGSTGRGAGRDTADEAGDDGDDEERAQRDRAEQERRRAEREAAEEAAERAEAAAREARERLAGATDEHDRAKRRRDEAEDTVGRLQQQLSDAREESDRAAAEERRARQARREAEEEADAAAAAARRARHEADSLTP